ncbi:structural maintenance of chromosomes protein 4-like [Ptychodera flava]|uniref:structural maintenance of chromosomes protein 4-like n=1 Tax=Ptychodera flava TaxID=63121 RepID=UPI00396AA585
MDDSETCVMTTGESSASEKGSEGQNTNEREIAGSPEKMMTEPVASPDEGARHGEPRLMITQIVNENFKSYAGKRTLGPFHKNFSSIVGPNGSGKSNVIDAMLFVFGYRANKIRSKKVSVLIHNSENHKNISSCSVHVHFQKIIDLPGEEYEVVPNSQFVISRTAYKDNSSNYYINGRKAPFKEVAALLRLEGIDLDHNRFLILQGEVEQIAMMKPKAPNEHEEGMLEYLEDIIGSSKYKEPIEELSKQVEELNEHRGEKLNRVKVVEKEKDELQGAKSEAVEYLTMENNIFKKKNTLYQKHLHKFNRNIEKVKEEKKEAETAIGDVKKQMDDVTEAIKTKSKEQKKIIRANEKLQTEVEERKNDFTEFEKEDIKTRENLKHAKSKEKKLQKALQKEKEKLEELKNVPGDSQKQIEKATKKKEELESQLKIEEEKLSKIMEGLKTETQGLQTEKDAKEKDLMGIQKSVNDAKSKMDVCRSELSLYKGQQDGLLSQLSAAKKNYEHAVTTVKDRQSAVKSMEKKIPELEKELEKGKKDLEVAVEAEKAATEEVRKNRVKVEEARSSMQAASSRGAVLEAIMGWKRSGKIPGIFGRMGDLGAIDEKYDVAISTACGALDHIVVDTMDTATTCVEYLKKHNVGKATFIGLDKMKTFEKHATTKIDTPENAPRLFDLVKVQDEKLLTAFYYALRNTLVANDLDQATRIAFQGSKRWRVVTLSGQLIDQSGTMSGGGNKVAKGRMGSAVISDVRKEDVEKMEKKLNADMKQAEQCHDNKIQLEEKVERLEKNLKEMKHSFDKYHMDIKALTEQESTSKTQVKELEEQVAASAPDKKKLAEMEKSLELKKKDYDKVAQAAAKIEAEVQKLHKQIMDIGGSKLNSQQAKVDGVTTEIDKCTGAITKANVAIKSADRNIKKAADKVESTENEIEENVENMKQLEERFKTLEEEATKVLQSYTEAQEKLKEASAVLEESKEEVTQLQAKQNDLKKQYLEVSHGVEKWDNLLKENQQKIKHYKKEISKLELHEVEGEEMKELPTLSDDELEGVDPEKIEYEIAVVEEDMQKMKPNMAAIAEYKKKEEMYLARVGELDEITDRRDKKRQEHEELRKERLNMFMAGFSIITNKLKEMYQMITLGGDAELELVDSLDPFSEGIVFSVRPPKKSWKNISNLSGGEKTLSSLALVFALHHYKPTPLYVMDEIDAALDFKNVSIIGNYIKERTKNAQFIIISLRNNMFELADRLIGIYKTDNCTKSVTINPRVMAQTVPVQG